MICDRCFKPEDEGEHGVGLCPFEPRRAAPTMIGDELLGGPRMFENLGHEPVYIQNRSSLKREMAARGVRHRVEHVGVPGTDKSPRTTRWI